MIGNLPRWYFERVVAFINARNEAATVPIQAEDEYLQGVRRGPTTQGANSVAAWYQRGARPWQGLPAAGALHRATAVRCSGDVLAECQGWIDRSKAGQDRKAALDSDHTTSWDAKRKNEEVENGRTTQPDDQSLSHRG